MAFPTALDGSTINALQSIPNPNQVVNMTHRIRSGVTVAAGLLTLTKTTIDANAGAALGTSIGSTLSKVGFGVYISSVRITPTRKVVIRFQHSPLTVGFPSYNAFKVLPANTETILLVNKYFRCGDLFNLGIKKWLDSDTTDLDVAIEFADSYIMPDEYILNAKVQACILAADSIMDGASGTATENMYIYMLRNELRRRGVDISIPYNHAISGKDSASFIPYVKNGYGFVPGCKLYIIAIGANDSAIASRTKADYKANIIQLLDLALSNPSDSPTVLLISPTHNENDTIEALNVQYRDAHNEILALPQYSDTGRVFGFNGGTGVAYGGADSFDRKVASNYMPTDTAGSRIHPSDIGNAGIFNNCIIPYLNSTAGQALISKLKSYS